MKTTVIEIGMHYNSTLARQEAGRALGLARQREALMNEQGITLRQLEELEAHGERLYPLDLAQTKTQQEMQRLTDLVERLLSRSIGTISRVYIQADVALGKINPQALESLPSRSGTLSVARNAASLLTCAQFVGVHREAFLAAGAPATLEEDLVAASRELSEADQAQEKSKVAAQEASNALFQCRGEIYLGCRRIYQAGRNLYRKEPQVQALFSFMYMARSSSSMTTSEGQVAAEKRAKRAERKVMTDAVVLAKRQAMVHAKASAAKTRADAARARAEAAQAKAARAQARMEEVMKGAWEKSVFSTGESGATKVGEGPNTPALPSVGREAGMGEGSKTSASPSVTKDPGLMAVNGASVAPQGAWPAVPPVPDGAGLSVSTNGLIHAPAESAPV